MLFAGHEVRIEKNCELDLCTHLGLWPLSLSKTSGTVFLNTGLPVSKFIVHIFIFKVHE